MSWFLGVVGARPGAIFLPGLPQEAVRRRSSLWQVDGGDASQGGQTAGPQPPAPTPVGSEPALTQPIGHGADAVSQRLGALLFSS